MSMLIINSLHQHFFGHSFKLLTILFFFCGIFFLFCGVCWKRNSRKATIDDEVGAGIREAMHPARTLAMLSESETQSSTCSKRSSPDSENDLERTLSASEGSIEDLHLQSFTNQDTQQVEGRFSEESKNEVLKKWEKAKIKQKRKKSKISKKKKKR